MKRKLSSPSASPPLTPSSALHHQEVVPTRNISIYYFKHSDTEPEPKSQLNNNSENANNIDDNNRGNLNSTATTATSSTKSRVNRAHCENSAIQQIHSDFKLANCTCTRSGCVGISASVNSNRRGNRHHACQKSRLFLDFDQEFEDDITSLKSYDEISFGSFDLDLDEDLEEEIVGVAKVEGIQEEQGDALNHPQLKQSEQDHYSTIMNLEESICSGNCGTTDSSSSPTVDQRETNYSLNKNISSITNDSSIMSAANASTVNNNSNKQTVSLDEIEELVQKAELLVQQTTRSRGVVVDCVDLPVEVGSSEDEDDVTLMLPQKHCADQHHHYHHHHKHHHNHLYQQKDPMMMTMIAQTSLKSNESRFCGIGSSSSIGETAKGRVNGSEHDDGRQELLHSSSPSASTSFHSLSVRKCSVSSGVSSSSTSAHKFVKSPKTSTTLSTLSSWSSVAANGVGVASNGGSVQVNCCNTGNITNKMASSPKGPFIVEACSNVSNCNESGIVESGISSPVATNGNNGSGNSAASPSNTVVTKTSKKSARVRQWIRAHNSEIVVNQKVSLHLNIFTHKLDCRCNSRLKYNLRIQIFIGEERLPM